MVRNDRRAEHTNRPNLLISFTCKLTYYMTNIKIKLTVYVLSSRVTRYVCLLSSLPSNGTGGERSFRFGCLSWLSAACCHCRFRRRISPLLPKFLGFPLPARDVPSGTPAAEEVPSYFCSFFYRA